MAFIEIRSVSKSYGNAPVINNLSLDVNEHEVVSLIGPSGSGKSTLLRCINGLEATHDGEIIVDGKCITSHGANLDVVRRSIGIVFQSYNLFPHMTVSENIMLAPINVLGRNKRDARARAMELLERVGLADKADAYPDHLSGGQQQRVAIARAIAMDPIVLLLDEVTSALDPELVWEVLDILRDLASDGMTMLLATHEMRFAKEVSSKVCFLFGGCVHEEGTPIEIFESPKRDRTREFLRNVAR